MKINFPSLDLANPGYLKNYDDFVPSKDQVLYAGPYWDSRELEASINSLLKGSWITSGEKVESFQRKFSKLFNVKYSHMVNSGSSANLVMLAALKKQFKWKDRDEIIVSPVGFATTFAPIIQNNLRPIFVDIEFDTLNFDVNEIEKKITLRTKAIMVSPVLGNPPDLDKIKDICERNNLLLIGDNCDSLGTKFNDKHLSEYYYASSCSFYPAHHICTGEGGMVSSDDEDLIKLVRSFSWWGRDCYCVGKSNTTACGSCANRFSNWLEDYDRIVDHKYIYVNVGYNLKPLDLQGAIGLVQLSKLEEISSKRKLHKAIIEDAILRKTHLKPINVLPNSDVCWFGIPVLCNDFEQKQSLVDHLEKNKIQTRTYFGGNILLHSAFRDQDNYKKYPNANQVLDRVFFLGCSPQYNEKVLNYIQGVIDQWNP